MQHAIASAALAPVPITGRGGGAGEYGKRVARRVRVRRQGAVGQVDGGTGGWGGVGV
jgi:hypothetical protein